MTSFLSRMRRQHTYDPVGKCIYCGAAEGRLTAEHIIPESLGGMLVLPAASCDACAIETGAFEGRCAGQIFRGPRRILGLPQKNRGRKRRAKPDTFDIKADGRSLEVEAHELPGMLVTFTFDPPGILANAEPREVFSGRICFQQLPGFGERLSNMRARHNFKDQIALPVRGDAADHGRLLAKIAHAYAVAELGIGGFRPFLNDIILNKPPLHIGHYVGGLFGDAPQGEDLHEILLGDEFWGDKHVVVEIQLFADRAMPKYLVVAGELSPRPSPRRPPVDQGSRV
jgi:HNH endonuclease